MELNVQIGSYHQPVIESVRDAHQTERIAKRRAGIDILACRTCQVYESEFERTRSNGTNTFVAGALVASRKIQRYIEDRIAETLFDAPPFEIYSFEYLFAASARAVGIVTIERDVDVVLGFVDDEYFVLDSDSRVGSSLRGIAGNSRLGEEDTGKA